MVDPTINPEKMEMYSDSQGRGGVLEATGVTEVKFKTRDCIAVMHMRDPELIQLSEQVRNLKDKNQILEIQKKIKQRESKLLPIYEQVAIDFVDLQDSPGRMKAKGCIRDIVEWEDSRTYFYYRMNRRLQEDYFLKELQKIDSTVTLENARTIALTLISKSVPEDQLHDFLEDDKKVYEWCNNNQTAFENAKQQIQSVVLSSKLIDFSKNFSTDTIASGLNQLLASLSPQKRAEILQALQKGNQN